MLTKEISNDVNMKSRFIPVSTKHIEGFSHVLQPPQSWLEFYRQLATIAGQAFSMNETILFTHTILLRLATDILSAQLSTK